MSIVKVSVLLSVAIILPVSGAVVTNVSFTGDVSFCNNLLCSPMERSGNTWSDGNGHTLTAGYQVFAESGQRLFSDSIFRTVSSGRVDAFPNTTGPFVYYPGILSLDWTIEGSLTIFGGSGTGNVSFPGIVGNSYCDGTILSILSCAWILPSATSFTFGQPFNYFMSFHLAVSPGYPSPAHVQFGVSYPYPVVTDQDGNPIHLFEGNTFFGDPVPEPAGFKLVLLGLIGSLLTALYRHRSQPPVRSAKPAA